MQSSYLTSAQKANQLPEFEFPEVAFLGRSNCGKSSLLNTLLQRKNLAKKSSTPGRTQMVNFFSLELSKEKQMIFADLPGYGFNIARKAIVREWEPLLEAYVDRKNLKACLFLCDSRRNFDEDEIDYIKWLGSKVPVLIVMTKIDKLKPKELKDSQQQLIENLVRNGLQGDVYWISNLNRLGIEELQKKIWHIGGF